MTLEDIQKTIVTKVYPIPADKKVPLHQHHNQDELFYCIKGEGFGVLEDSEVTLTPGKVFIAPAGKMHALRSENNLYVASIMIPVIED